MDVEKAQEDDANEPLISGTIYHAFLFLSFVFLAIILVSQAIPLLKYKIHMEALAIVLAVIFAFLIVSRYDYRRKISASKIPDFVVLLVVLVPTLLIASLVLHLSGSITSILMAAIAAIIILEFKISDNEVSEV